MQKRKLRKFSSILISNYARDFCVKQFLVSRAHACRRHMHAYMQNQREIFSLNKDFINYTERYDKYQTLIEVICCMENESLRWGRREKSQICFDRLHKRASRDWNGLISATIDFIEFEVGEDSRDIGSTMTIRLFKKNRHLLDKTMNSRQTMQQYVIGNKTTLKFMLSAVKWKKFKCFSSRRAPSWTWRTRRTSPQYAEEKTERILCKFIDSIFQLVFSFNMEESNKFSVWLQISLSLARSCHCVSEEWFAGSDRVWLVKILAAFSSCIRSWHIEELRAKTLLSIFIGVWM